MHRRHVAIFTPLLGVLACSGDAATELSERTEAGLPDAGFEADASSVAPEGSGGIDGTGGRAGSGGAAPVDGSVGAPDVSARTEAGTVDAGPHEQDAAQDAAPDVPPPECVEPGDCVLPDTVPADCAEADCVENACVFLARDADNDGFRARRCQSLIIGVEVETGLDCNDADDAVNPDAWDGPAGEGHEDACNDGIDNDCSNVPDDGVLSDSTTCVCAPGLVEACSTTPSGLPIDFPVLNQDGTPVGLCALGSRECLPDGTWGPCTDAIAPQPESCDELDNDCDTLVDEEAQDRVLYYCDADSDEFLAPAASGVLSCSAPGAGCTGTWLESPDAALFRDCDDANSDRFPGNAERCDDVDQDCDGLVDEVGSNENALKTAYYCDADSDGHLLPNAQEVLACSAPKGCAGDWLTNPAPGSFNDCDDAAPDRFTGNTETCDDIDNDCDTLIDEVGTVENGLKSVFYRDRDGDGRGANGSAIQACTPPNSTWIDTDGDCRDNPADPLAPSIHEGAPEICDGEDNDCDGNTDATDGDLVPPPSGIGATYQCGGSSGWVITACAGSLLHCDNNITNGCETDGTQMTTCHACNTSCYFDCGSQGCDEVADITGGFGHTCVATAEGRAWCWGQNFGGQLGDSSTNPHNDPTAVSNLTQVSKVVAGYGHTCAIAGASNTLYCWGSDLDGQLGSSAASGVSTTPVAVNGTTGVISLAAGNAHTCAVLSGGLVRCWGQNTSGQVGNGTNLAGTPADVVTPTTVLDVNLNNVDDGVQVVAGANHSCVRHTNQTVSCWGNNGSNQLGNTGGNVSKATPVAGLTGVTDLAAGTAYTCAVSGGHVYCWGSNDNLELGRTGAGPFSTPQQVASLSDAVTVAAGFETTCVRRSTGAVECWGGNTSGQRGEAPSPASASRTIVPISNAAQIAAGPSGFNCARRTAGDTYCWGALSSGTTTHIPQLVIE